MKKILVMLITIVTLSVSQRSEAQVNVGVSFDNFYSELSPYGRWIDYPQYGRVWIYNRTGFRPYYDDGHWEYTSYGWTWASDYPWGWAAFHYGRWAYIPAYGWAWVPGYEWAPAWVGWCQNDGYYGWAPLAPGFGFGSNYSFNSFPMDRWVFVQHRYINDRSLRNHCIYPAQNSNVYQNVTVINNTQINNNVNYYAGPRREDVERSTRQKITVKNVAFAPAPGKTIVKNNQVEIYKPDMNNTKQSVTDNTRNNMPQKSVKNQPVLSNTQQVDQQKINSTNKPQQVMPVDKKTMEQQQQESKVQKSIEDMQNNKKQQAIPQEELDKTKGQQLLQAQEEQKIKQQEMIRQQQQQKQLQQAQDLQRQQQQVKEQQRIQQQQEIQRKQDADRQQQLQQQRQQQMEQQRNRQLQQQNELRQQQQKAREQQQVRPVQRQAAPVYTPGVGGKDRKCRL